MMRCKNSHLKKTLFAGVLALALVAGGAAWAQGPGDGTGDGMRGKGMGPGVQPCLDGDFGSRAEFRIQHMAARLGLTDDQTAAIAKIHEEDRQANLEVGKEMMRLRNELRGEMLKDDPSEKTILALNGKLGELRTQRQANRLKTRLAVREQLTPEQRDQMLLMGDFGKDHRGGRHGMCGDRMGSGRGGGRDFDCHPDRNCGGRAANR